MIYRGFISAIIFKVFNCCVYRRRIMNEQVGATRSFMCRRIFWLLLKDARSLGNVELSLFLYTYCVFFFSLSLSFSREWEWNFCVFYIHEKTKKSSAFGATVATSGCLTFRDAFATVNRFRTHRSPFRDLLIERPTKIFSSHTHTHSHTLVCVLIIASPNSFCLLFPFLKNSAWCVYVLSECWRLQKED
jgi:hypothetical protein